LPAAATLASTHTKPDTAEPETGGLPVGDQGHRVANRAEPSSESTARHGLIAELGRRHVWRAAVLYIGGAWALAQGIAQLGPFFGAPDWIVRWFVIACIIGFPFWVAFAWFYEFTPQGIQRESEIEGQDAAFHRATGRKLDFWIIGVLVLAVVLLITNQFVLRRDATSVANAASAKAIAAELAKVPAKSVAVLPFGNENDDPRQRYFSDGLSEELISDLTQIDGLKVIGKTSSFQFRHSHDTPAQIGATLGVANLIEGSVRQRGGRIRIVVGMIRTRDGASVWAHSYDQPLKDVFAIQTQIGEAITAALKIKLLGKPLVNEEQPPSGNLEAYQLMLQGRAIGRTAGTAAEYRQGIALLEKATRVDPGYAYAWNTLSNSLINLGTEYLHGEQRQRVYAQARAAVAREWTLAPNTADAYRNRGYMLSMLDQDQIGALADFRRALALAPNDGAAMSFMALQLSIVGQLQQSADLWRKALVTDPLRPDWYLNLSGVLSGQEQIDAAERVARKALALHPGYPDLHQQLVLIDIARDDSAAAMRDATQETDPVAKDMAVAAAQQISRNPTQADAALRAYLTQHGETQPYYVADLYAIRRQPDEMFKWLDRAWTQHDANLNNLLADPFALRYRQDPRFTALCHKIGLPAPGEPLPAATTSTP
jgi:TolB-like protein/Tfp pilus assembly protein PilF